MPKPDHRPLVVLTSCGTSVLTNDTTLGALLRDTANTTDEEYAARPVADRARLDEHFALRRKDLEQADEARATRLSAELNALTKLNGDERIQSFGDRDIHLLVHTQTHQGAVAADMLGGWIRDRCHPQSVQSYAIPELSTGDPTRFESGMDALVRWCVDTLEGYRATHRIVFNLTGGFKAVQGYLQVLGMLYADEIAYIFEAPDSPLLLIPRLPVRLDLEGQFERFFDVFRRIEAFGHVPRAECEGISEALLLVVDEEAGFSPWGALVWKQESGQHFRQNLVKPLTSAVSYSQTFSRQVKALAPDDLERANRQLDRLAAYLTPPKSSRGSSPKSLSFKEFKGGRGASTHENYAWSDGNASRMFGHFADGSYVLDTLEPHPK